VRIWRRSRALALACAAVWMLAGCTVEPSAKDAPPATLTRAIEVNAVMARAEEISTPIRASGTVAAMQTSNVTALVEGPVDRVFVRVGDRVTRGQPLLRIRQADYHRRTSEAKAALRLAEAEVVQTERAFQRVRELKDRGFAPTARLDERRRRRGMSHARGVIRRRRRWPPRCRRSPTPYCVHPMMASSPSGWSMKECS